MKKLSGILLLFASLLLHTSVQANCTFSDYKFRLISYNTITCEGTFDLTWSQMINSGNKFAYIHIWSEQNYQTPAENWVHMYHRAVNSPTAADLINVLSTIVIEDNHADIPYLGTIYRPDPKYILPQLTGMSLVKVHLNNSLLERITIQNIKFKLPACTGVQQLYFDMWVSQAANGKIVQCALEGIHMPINQLNLIGQLNCAIPSGIQLIMNNQGDLLSNVGYKIYIDESPIGIINSADSLIIENDKLSLPANSITYYPAEGYQYYNVSLSSYNKPLIADIIIEGWHASQVLKIENSCGVMPIIINSFNATYAKGKGVLNWQSSFEQNVSRYEIQKKTSRTSFVTIATVPAIATNGNSNNLHQYYYNDDDISVSSGNIFYRIGQISTDGTVISYSEIKSVELKATTMNLAAYPNPSTSAIYVDLPKGAGLYTISLHNLAGQELQKWIQVPAQKFEIKYLKTGIYLLTIVKNESFEKVVQKIVRQ